MKNELLSGKCKEAFLNWLENQDLSPCKVIFDELHLIMQQAYILEFLQSIGEIGDGSRIRHFLLQSYQTDWLNTLSAANNDAIKKANETYNQNFSD